MNIINVIRQNFENIKVALVRLYIDTFSSGKSFQFYDEMETTKYLEEIFDAGYGIVAMENDKPAGAILITPLVFDEQIPEEIRQNYDVDESVYVAEMMVEKSKQGQGVGKKLMEYFLSNVDKRQYSNAFIRVWVENKPAINLYEKMGFRACASIVQARLLADKSGMYDFKKIYLHQKLK